MSAVLDWDVERDRENIRDKAIDLRSRDAQRLYMPNFQTPASARSFLASPRTHWRRKVLERFELLTGERIHGRVLEIGAGTGWCSALLSQKSSVEAVYSLDYESYCVQTLMPHVARMLAAREEKITRVLGSYNCMAAADCEFDLVVSIGALHHSENLPLSMRECYRVIKPGGRLLASEHCEYNSLTLAEQRSGENEIVDAAVVARKYGADVGTVRAKDNSDHAYRLCEFESAALAAGFDVLTFVFDHTRTSGGLLSLVARMARDALAGDGMFRAGRAYRGFSRNVAYPYFAREAFRSSSPTYDNLMLVLHKPRSLTANRLFR